MQAVLTWLSNRMVFNTFFRYDFRAFLRKTSFDPGRKTLRKTIEYHGEQVDFRKVLRKNSQLGHDSADSIFNSSEQTYIQ